MKSLSSAQLASRQGRGGVSCRGLLWITARNRSTGEPESIGLWTGDDHETFSIRGEGRIYYGAGNLLDLGDTVSEVGVQVRTRTVKLSALTPEVIQAVKGYDARLARVEIHRAEYDTSTGNLIDEPSREFKGWIDKINMPRPSLGGEYNCTLDLVSIARSLTRTLAQKFSDTSQRLRNSSDGLFKYTDVSGSSDFWWGEKRAGQ